jgi:hypothetical protein
LRQPHASTTYRCTILIALNLRFGNRDYSPAARKRSGKKNKNTKKEKMDAPEPEVEDRVWAASG